MNNKKVNFVYLRKPLQNKKDRPVKAKIYKNKINKIDIYKNGYDLDVVGPFKFSLKSINSLKMIYKSINTSEFLKMSCYTFFGKIVDYTNLDYEILNDLDWYEINTLKDYKESFKEKIFIKNIHIKNFSTN